MAATDNLTSLHKHEEELRARSLAAIKADTALSDHWNLVGEAMNAIYAFTHDPAHRSENELTLQFLGIRLFNAAGASVTAATGCRDGMINAGILGTTRSACRDERALATPSGWHCCRERRRCQGVPSSRRIWRAASACPPARAAARDRSAR